MSPQHRYKQRTAARRELLDDIQQQYQRRQAVFESAGGDPHRMQGSLTCYLEYALLRRALPRTVRAKEDAA